MPLSSETAVRLINASQEEARKLGVAVSTAIVDADGHLFAFARMDDARWVSIETAQAKAYTGALFGRDGPDLQQVNPTVLSALSTMHGHALLAMGSVTTLHDGPHLIAGIGCSGATDDQDAQCAHAARKAYFG
jgi:glc operon protein GlcG